LLPESKAAYAYRVFAPDAYPRIRDIVERTVTSALIYLPSSAKDFVNPAIEPYLQQYVRGSHGIGHRERIKILKLLWDATGTEFGGRHELYERNYAGSWEDVRMQTYASTTRGAAMKEMEALVDQCLSDYDESGWRDATWAEDDRP
jgi:4-hydroxyphenylacetate 3-monooxygenase